MSRSSQLLVHTHAAEQLDEVDLVRRIANGQSNIQYLVSLGLGSARLCVAHCVWVDEAEQAVLAEHRANVLHCPGSNLKLGSGIAPVPEQMRARGITVSLGADGAACNNRLDMFDEMRLAAALQAMRAGPGRLAARDVVWMATRAGARAACGGACHQFPEPDILPRSAWRDALVRMMLIQDRLPEPASGAHLIPLPPDYLSLQRYYEAHAPERLPDPEPWPPPGADGRVTFQRRALTPPGGGSMPAIANVRLYDVNGDGRLDIVASDMRHGLVLAGYAENDYALETIAELRHPARIEQVDLDGDGLQDLLVADLGSFQPADHDRGALVWLRQTRDREGRVSFDAIELASGLARAADFTGNGKLDIVMAIFGWRYTGSVTLFENQTTDWDSPTFVPKVIEARTGAIHVPVVDLNGNGRLDFVALYAQEHEMVVAHINEGDLQFTPRTLYTAPHPNWGFSGMQLADLNQNGKLDVLLTHPDTFDDRILKPYHGIQWLENLGDLEFREHTLAKLPGVHRAHAVDLDGDGTLDIVACVMIAHGGGELEPRLASLVWLEQVEPGVFERRTLEMGQPVHATLDVGDLTGNGKPDLVVGRFFVSRPLDAWLDLWQNVTP